MKVLLDTNVIIDWLSKREPFAVSAKKLVDKTIRGDFEAYASASTITDIYYTLRRATNSSIALECVAKIVKILQIADTSESIILQAIQSKMPDFEDAVQAETARKLSLDYIITRDLKDFQKSPVPALNPNEFLSLLSTL